MPRGHQTGFDQRGTDQSAIFQGIGHGYHYPPLLLLTFGNSPALLAARTRLHQVKTSNGNDHDAIQRIARDAVADLDPEHRAFFCQALMLYALNERLSIALGKLVIRHRRHTEHRLTLVGEEYVFPDKAKARQDRHILHAAPASMSEGMENSRTIY